MEDQNNLAFIRIHVHDDFLDECSHDAFLQPGVGPRILPD
jgi:hypothetical protein